MTSLLDKLRNLASNGQHDTVIIRVNEALADASLSPGHRAALLKLRAESHIALAHYEEAFTDTSAMLNLREQKASAYQLQANIHVRQGNISAPPTTPATHRLRRHTAAWCWQQFRIAQACLPRP